MTTRAIVPMVPLRLAIVSSKPFRSAIRLAMARPRRFGCGIPERVPRVFDRFFAQASAETVGNGLGLAIAKRIGRSKRLELTIANRNGTIGTIARVVIPAAG